MKRNESLDRNQEFKLRQELGNARDVRPRVEIFDTITGGIGVRAVVLLDYRRLTDNPYFRSHALAAELLFNDLSPRAYLDIMRQAMPGSGATDAACEEARRQAALKLLATGKAVCLSRDADLLALAGQHGVADDLIQAVAAAPLYAGEDLRTTRAVIPSLTVEAQVRASLNVGFEDVTEARVRTDVQRAPHYAWGPILERERVNVAPALGL